MEQFISGSNGALEELYYRYSKRLLGFLYRMLNNNEQLAQDKLHDIFTKIIENPSAFDTNRNFKFWLFAVAANECKKHYRKSSLAEDDIENVEIGEESKTIDKIHYTHFSHELKSKLDLLSYEHRCTFTLRFQEKMSVNEISKIMDCPKGTVKSRIHHSTKQLAKTLHIFNPNKEELR